MKKTITFISLALILSACGASEPAEKNNETNTNLVCAISNKYLGKCNYFLVAN